MQPWSAASTKSWVKEGSNEWRESLSGGTTNDKDSLERSDRGRIRERLQLGCMGKLRL